MMENTNPTLSTTETDYSDDGGYLGDTTNYILGSVDLVISVPSMVLNAVVFCFYRSKLDRIVPLSFAGLALRLVILYSVLKYFLVFDKHKGCLKTLITFQ